MQRILILSLLAILCVGWANSQPPTAPPHNGGDPPTTPPRNGGDPPTTPPRNGGHPPTTPPRNGGDMRTTEAPRLPPGVNDDGTRNVDQMTLRSIAALVAEGDLGDIDGPELCRFMFSHCATIRLVRSVADVTGGVNCFNRMENYEAFLAAILDAHCPAGTHDYMCTMIQEVCDMTLGREHLGYSVCVRMLNCGGTDEELSDRVENGEFERSESTDEDARRTAELLTEGGIDRDGVRTLVDNELGADVPDNTRREAEPDVIRDELTVEERMAFYGGEGMEDVRTREARFEADNLDFGNLSEDDLDILETIMPYIAALRDIVEQIAANTVRAILTQNPGDFAENVRTPTQGQALADRTRESDDYEPADLLVNAGTAGTLRPNEIAGMSADDIRGLSQEIAEYVVDTVVRQLARVVEDELTPGDMTVEDMEANLGVLSEFSSNFFNNVALDAIQGVLRHIPASLDRSRARALLRRFEDDGRSGPEIMCQNGLADSLGNDELRELTASEMGVDGETDYLHTVQERTARIMMERYEEDAGVSPGADTYDEHWSPSQILTFICVFAQGASEQLLEEMPRDNLFLVLAGIIEQQCQMSAGQRECINEVVGNVEGDLTVEEQTQGSAFLTERPQREMENIEDDTERCEVYESVIAERAMQDATTMTAGELERQCRHAMTHRCVDGVGVDMSEGSITSEMVDGMGTILLGCSRDFFSRLDMDDSAMELVSSQIGEAGGTALMTSQNAVDQLAEQVPQVTSDNVATYAPLVPDAMHVQGDDVVDDDALSSGAAEIIQACNSNSESRQERQDSGLDTTTSNNDGNAVQRVFEERSDALRKKRTASITCSEVTLAGAASVYFTADELSTLGDFTDCVTTLSAIENWSDNQLDELVVLAKVAWGNDVSTWSNSEMELAGSIIAGLSVMEIESLVLDSNDVMAVLGQYSLYTNPQLEAAFETYLNRVHSNDASSLGDEDLIDLGEFLCGATASNIGYIDHAEYETSASDIGSLRLCDERRMQALADLAMQAFGEVDMWSAVDISTVGNMIGGISGSDMRSLTETQISSISATAIALVPADTLAALSTTQIGYLSSSQAEAVTEEQQEEFTNAQLDALEDAGGTIEVNYTSDDSRAGAIAASVLTLLVTFIAERIL